MGSSSELMADLASFTGLSPTEFFAIAALMVVVYRTISAMFVSPEDFNKPPVAMSVDPSSGSGSGFLAGALDPPAKDQKDLRLGDMTEKELRGYDGSDPEKPLLISVRGQIYDVSSSRMFYGRGGSYSMFTGKEASRALALLSFKPQDINGNLEDLGPDELQVLEDWEFKFEEKYAKVGKLVSESTPTEQARSQHSNESQKTELKED